MLTCFCVFYGDFLLRRIKSFHLSCIVVKEMSVDYNLYKFYEKGFLLKKHKKGCKILLEIKAKCKNKTDQIVAGSLMGRILMLLLIG